MEQLFTELKNELFKKIDNSDVRINTKLDAITIRTQDVKINDLNQRVESLEKAITYSDALKTPSKPDENVNNPKKKEVPKDDTNKNLTVQEIMKR